MPTCRSSCTHRISSSRRPNEREPEPGCAPRAKRRCAADNVAMKRRRLDISDASFSSLTNHLSSQGPF